MAFKRKISLFISALFAIFLFLSSDVAARELKEISGRDRRAFSGDGGFFSGGGYFGPYRGPFGGPFGGSYGGGYGGFPFYGRYGPGGGFGNFPGGGFGNIPGGGGFGNFPGGGFGNFPGGGFGNIPGGGGLGNFPGGGGGFGSGVGFGNFPGVAGGLPNNPAGGRLP